MSGVQGISIVIPNFNGAILLPQVLPTVYAAAENTRLPFEIIVADDCSTDETLPMLSRNFPGVKQLQNEKNSGFAITSNKGISAAKYDWVLLLNSDVKLEPSYFLPLLKYTERENVFGVMGRIIGWDDEQIQDGAKYPFFHGVKIKTSGNYLLEDKEAMKEGVYSMYVSGANAFLNKKHFLGIGGFDEIFSPFYVEDFELSLRAWRLGYECYYDDYAVCRHRTSSTIPEGNRKNFIRKIYNRNKMYLHAIHLNRSKRLLWFIQLAFETLVQLITFKKFHGQAVVLFIKSYKKVIKSREELKAISGGRGLLSVADVVNKIASSVRGKNIHRF